MRRVEDVWTTKIQASPTARDQHERKWDCQVGRRETVDLALPFEVVNPVGVRRCHPARSDHHHKTHNLQHLKT
jgi:hypothetical protein